MIEIKRHEEYDEQIKRQLDRMIEHEFGQVPIVKETTWSAPDWTIIDFVDGQIASLYNIVERDIFIDEKVWRTAGINNVITSSAFRGQGLATKVMAETSSFIFEDLNCELALLLCADALIPFYERLEYRTVSCPVFFDQPHGKKLWMANTMLRSRGDKIEPQNIDLNGLPW